MPWLVLPAQVHHKFRSLTPQRQWLYEEQLKQTRLDAEVCNCTILTDSVIRLRILAFAKVLLPT